MRRAPVAAALALAIAPSALLAQLPIAVRARARFDDLQARPEGLQARISGSLRDDLGRPVPLARVHVGAIERRTGPDGRFQAELRFPTEGQHAVPIGFAGDLLLGPARAELPIELGRRGVRLSLQPQRTSVAAGEPISWRVLLEDRAGQAEPDAALAWRIDDAPWRTAPTDARGTATLNAPPLGPGAHLLEIRFGGDPLRGPARLSLGFEATRPLGITLHRLGGDDLHLAGQVTPGPGAAQVALILDGRPALRLRTDDQGHWSARLPTDGLAAGPHVARALAWSDAPGWSDGRSPELEFEHTPPPPPSPAWRLAPAGVALGALLALAWRRRPRRPRVQRAPPPPTRPPPASTLWIEPVATRPDHIEIRLVDALDDRPLTGWILPGPGAGPLPFTAPPDATVAPAGRWTPLPDAPRLWAGAVGYGSADHPIPGPGRATVSLLPAPAWTQRRFDALLQRAGQPALHFGIQTPREAARALRDRGAPAGPLEALLAHVESACFGRDLPLPLERIDALARTIEASLG